LTELEPFHVPVDSIKRPYFITDAVDEVAVFVVYWAMAFAVTAPVVAE
jgi:hypothetical protein